MAKGLVILAWAWGIASLALPAMVPGARFGVWMFWFLLVAHTLECLIFLPKLKRAAGSLGGHLVQTLIFGIVHVRGLRNG